jgi:hypothetical protein
MTSTALADHQGVAISVRSLTHLTVRSLPSSMAPWPALTMAGDEVPPGGR